MKQNKVAVVLATLQYSPQDISSFLDKYKNTAFSSLNVVIQNNKLFQNFYLKRLVFNKKNISLMFLSKQSKTNACNKMIEYTKEDIIAFTDDDCAPLSNWAKNAIHFFNKKKRSEILFGRILPGNNERLENNNYCPSVFTHSEVIPAALGDPFWKHVGLGSNMFIKKSVFKKIGGFKPWLGPGTFLGAGEDAELILRCQIAGYKIYFDKNVIVRHDKWLSYKENRILNSTYTSATIAAHSFYFFQGVSELKGVLKTLILETLSRVKSDIAKTFFQKSPLHIFLSLNELAMIVIGLTFGFIYANFTKIPQKEDVVKRFYKYNK